MGKTHLPLDHLLIVSGMRVVRVVVTGGSGYLGGRLCAAPAGAGHAVRAFVRRSSDVSGLPESVELAYGDVSDAESLAAAFDGCDAVFHVAAAVEPWLPDPSVFITIRMRDRQYMFLDINGRIHVTKPRGSWATVLET